MIERLLKQLVEINPHIPESVREQAAQLITKPETPILIKNNKAFHRLLLEGVKVNYKEDGQDKTNYVQLIDFANVSNNQFLVVNQFTVSGMKQMRRPDIIVFINGFPLAHDCQSK